MEKVIFYREWLPLPKAEFNVLAMIAEQGGSFSGNYADMCRYLNISVQDSNRKALQRAVKSLVSVTDGHSIWRLFQKKKQSFFHALGCNPSSITTIPRKKLRLRKF